MKNCKSRLESKEKFHTYVGLDIVLIRHGWPIIKPEVHADQWVLSDEAYHHFAQYLNKPELHDISVIYTSPQTKARQTASFYFNHFSSCQKILVHKDLAEATRPAYFNPPDGRTYQDVVSDYLTGKFAEKGWENWFHLEKRIIKSLTNIIQSSIQSGEHKIAIVGHGLLFTALLKQILQIPRIDLPHYWKQIPFGPYVILHANMSGEINWVNEISQD